MKKTIDEIIKENVKVMEGLSQNPSAAIEKAAVAIIDSLKAGGKVIVFGNGGSAADSQHFSAELVGRFKKERRPLAALALTTNTSTLTAVANDYSFEAVFSRQIEALAKKGDIAIGISTSGNSRNVLEGVRMAKAYALTTIALTGGNGGILKELCDISIIADSKDTARIQEAHITILHIICELIERWMLK